MRNMNGHFWGSTDDACALFQPENTSDLGPFEDGQRRLGNTGSCRVRLGERIDQGIVVGVGHGLVYNTSVTSAGDRPVSRRAHQRSLEPDFCSLDLVLP